MVRNYSPSKEIDKRLEKIITGKINADIVIFGSSRGARNVLAENIYKETGISCYNLSYPGSDIDFHDFLLSELLDNKNRKPKVVILVVDDPDEFLSNTSIHFRLDRLYPLVKYNKIRNKLVELGEKNNVLSILSITHQLNKSNFDFRQKHFTELDSLLPLGSMPISFQRKNYEFVFTKPTSYPLNKEMIFKRNKFIHFVNNCKNNNISLIIAFPPNFGVANKGFEKRIYDLSNNKNVYYLSYNKQDERYRKMEFYFDHGHLNIKGAEIFTGELISFLNNNILSIGKN